jgi:hypothetical protein
MQSIVFMMKAKQTAHFIVLMFQAKQRKKLHLIDP